ncbi:MAG: hypothetical protein EZS28_023974 [Streblomastix strix]|uniref:Uncharacterized protein n=1 Tax=Streblomastix strix TaxID=222440 RepID=A0A5J4VDD9_9EUKA|nr:MAG: hypothetical protein EZS28_023974 [Streblomastix strix]
MFNSEWKIVANGLAAFLGVFGPIGPSPVGGYPRCPEFCGGISLCAIVICFSQLYSKDWFSFKFNIVAGSQIVNCQFLSRFCSVCRFSQILVLQTCVTLNVYLNVS